MKNIEDLDEEELRDVIASESEKSEDSDRNLSEDEKDLKKLEEYRAKLLGGTKGDISEIFRKRDHEKKDGINVDFGVGFGEDIGQKMLDEKEEREQEKKESNWEKHQRKLKEKKREKKMEQKERTKKNKEIGKKKFVEDETPQDLKKKA